MIPTVIDLTNEWLQDGAQGLNVQLPAVPGPNGHSPPPPVLFYNENEHPWVARTLTHRDALIDPVTKEQRPALVIRFPDLEDEGAVRQPVLPEQLPDGGVLVPVLLNYLRRKVATEARPTSHATMVREARQTMRTVARVVAQRFAHAHQVYDRDQCEIGMAPSGVVLLGRYLDATDDEVLDAAMIPFTVTDRWAMGIDP